MSDFGSIMLISGPSGAGKTTLVAKLVEQEPDLITSISYTTRPRRDNETDGVNYNFISNDEFQQKLAAGEFLEHAEIFGNNYGTSQTWVDDKLKQGIDVVLEIDWQGAAQVKEKFGDRCVTVFILPPNRKELLARLENRAQDNADVISNRMRKVREEIGQYKSFEYIIINSDFDGALADIQTIYRSICLRQCRQVHENTELFNDLLAK